MHHFYFEKNKDSSRDLSPSPQVRPASLNNSYEFFSNSFCNLLFERSPNTHFHFDKQTQKGILFSGFSKSGPDWIQKRSTDSEFATECFEKAKSLSPEALIDCSGQYFLLTFDAASKEVICFTSGLSNLRIFAGETKSKFILSNNLATMHHQEPSLTSEVDEIGVCSFLLAGRILKAETFFKKIKCAPLLAKVVLRDQLIFESSNATPKSTKAESLDESAERVFLSLKSAVQTWSSRIPIRSINLSGGIDSRAIIECLSKDVRERLLFTTTVQPHLSMTTDRDAILAALVVQKYKLKHEFIHPLDAKASYSFLMASEKHRPALTGCTGGELIGGLALNLSTLPKDQQDLETRIDFLKANFTFKNESLAAAAEGIQFEINQKSTERELFNEFSALHFAIRSTRDPIIIRAWSAPYNFAIVSQSPFWDADFIQEVLRTPVEHVKNARLYARIFELFMPTALQIPFNSNLCELQPHIFQSSQDGIHPKANSIKSHPSEMELNYLEPLFPFIKKNFSHIATDEIPKNIENGLKSLGTMYSDLSLNAFFHGAV